MSLDLDDVPDRLRPAAAATLQTAGVEDGHLAIEIVGEERIRELNRDHRGKDEPTDVLSFPVDESGGPGPVELGDVFICPEFSFSEIEVAVHGILHLCGYDHETDSGEMLDLQERIVTSLGVEPRMTMETSDE